MGWGGHSVDDAIWGELVGIARAKAGLSAGVDFEGYRAFIYPHDPVGQARQFCFGFTAAGKFYPPQYACALVCLGVAREAGRSGKITVDGREVDAFGAYGPLCVNSRTQATALLETLGLQHGLLQVPDAETPAITPACAIFVGGDDGRPRGEWRHGGGGHAIFVCGVEPASRGGGLLLETVEGGQIDGKNSSWGTAILALRREVYRHRGGWWLRELGSEAEGREIRWWFNLAEVPS